MEKSEFLSFFYKHSMHVLTAPLFAATCDDRPSKGMAAAIIVSNQTQLCSSYALSPISLYLVGSVLNFVEMFKFECGCSNESI